VKRRLLLTLVVLALLAADLTSCAPVDLAAPVPSYDTGIDPNTWAQVPAGSFLSGQHNDPVEIRYDYEMMVTPVIISQYVEFLNTALAAGRLVVMDDRVVSYYPGDAFHGARHEIRIGPGNYLIVPTTDPASRFTFDGTAFSAQSGWENHPVTNVSWFGAVTYCGYFGYSLPTELEYEKAARGTVDDRPYPWGYEIARNNANFLSSRDPFEDMGSFGSWTTPVGFYNGKAYNGYQTLDSASPYGIYDLSGNVWQWMADVTAGMHDRFLRGGSKDSYEMDLRIWVRNSAVPTYYGPAVGFRCVKK